MSDRVSTTISTSPSAPPSTGPVSGRYFITGQTNSGPHTEAKVISSLADFVALYGARTGATAMYDAFELAKRAGASEVVVMRAAGPSATKATITLSAALAVTAKYVGSYANGWTAAWDNTAKTLTVVAGSATEVYYGTTIADLIAAASASSRIDVSGSLPAGTVAATPLAGGGDDYASVAWATTLGYIDPSFGPGAIAAPGVAYATIGQALATHCAANYRIGLIAASAGSTAAQAVTAIATAKAYTNSTHLALVWPWVKVPDGAGGWKTVDPVSFAGGLRARAHALAGIGDSPIQEAFAKAVTDVVPELPCSSSDFATLYAARASVVRSIAGITRLYSWQTLTAPGSNNNLFPGVYRDLINYYAWAGSNICEAYTGKPASGAMYAALVSDLAGMLSPHSGTYLAPRFNGTQQVDPGYRVQANTGALAADNRVSAQVSVRLQEQTEFVDFTVAAGDATVTI